MWCVPTAVARLIGWNRERVWLEILADRLERGRKLTNIPGRITEPHGGLHAAEALRVLDRAGWECVSLWDGTQRLDPVDAIEVMERAGGKYLILQRMHLAHYDCDRYNGPDTLIMSSQFPVAKMWRVRRKTASRERDPAGGPGAEWFSPDWPPHEGERTSAPQGVADSDALDELVELGYLV